MLDVVIYFSALFKPPPPVLIYTPPVLIYTPPVLIYTPPVLIYTPPVLIYTPPVLIYTPPVLIYTPPGLIRSTFCVCILKSITVSVHKFWDRGSDDALSCRRAILPSDSAHPVKISQKTDVK